MLVVIAPGTQLIDEIWQHRGAAVGILFRFQTLLQP
jgi:hypothetical protein